MSDTAPQFAAESYEALIDQFGLSFDPSQRDAEEAKQPLDRAGAARKLVEVLLQFTDLPLDDAGREADVDKRVVLPLKDGTVAVVVGSLAMWPSETLEPTSAQVILAHMTDSDAFIGDIRSFNHRGYKENARVEEVVDDNRRPISDGQVDQLGNLLEFARQYTTD